MKEIWKDVKGYEGLYQVSDLGRVNSLDHYAQRGRGLGLYKSKIIKPTKSIRNYLRVRLSKNGEVKNSSIHRLVAEAFIPNPNKYHCINHKNFNTHDNNVNNLEWCTQSENCNHNIINFKGSKQHKTVIVMNGEIKTFPSMSKASEFLGFKRGWIATNFKRKGNPFKYKNILIEVVNYKCSIS